MTKGQGRDIRFKTIDLERLVDYEADDWSEWYHPDSPTDTGTDRDIRKILKIEDVWRTNAPFNDTSHMLPGGIEMLRQSGQGWQPRQLVGADPEARAPISHSPTFLPPSYLAGDLPSATSRGHLPKFHRPSRVGAGWGDYDLFHEWQLNGHQVKKSMVADKEWKMIDGPTVQFVPPATRTLEQRELPSKWIQGSSKRALTSS